MNVCQNKFFDGLQYCDTGKTVTFKELINWVGVKFFH